MKILLVDDEYLALNLLEEFIGRLPGLEVVGKAKNPVQALEILEKEQVDLLSSISKCLFLVVPTYFARFSAHL